VTRPQDEVRGAVAERGHAGITPSHPARIHCTLSLLKLDALGEWDGREAAADFVDGGACARVHRDIANPGPDAQFGYPSDEDYRDHLRMVLSRHEAGRDAWIFAYGSLIWKPAVDHAEERIGTARGWHRSFRMRLTRGAARMSSPA